MENLLNLFKSMVVEDYTKTKEASEILLKATVARGFIFAPNVIAAYSEKDLLKVTELIGLSDVEINNSFHKSWQKVKDATIEQLVLEQVMHYLTTYGFEALGVYDNTSVYIPMEELDIPKIDVDKIKLIIIRGITKTDLKEKIMQILYSGIALKSDTINDIINICIIHSLLDDNATIDYIKNKEVKVVLYEYYDILPENPVEFLRYLVYRLTKDTLLIKSKEAIKKLENSDRCMAALLLAKYKRKHGFNKLAEIFNRFKPIFLALKGSSSINYVINTISRLSKKYHKPMAVDFLNNITADIANDKDIQAIELNAELAKVNTFRKIRLAYALRYRLVDSNAILYRIRNGKAFATTRNVDKKNKHRYDIILSIVLSSIVNDLAKNVEGKTIYIPKYLEYALPSSEKQFTGNIPSGTCVSIPNNMIFGIHWNNVNNIRIDLDLSLLSKNSGKIGWDGEYRTDNGELLFSGDITNAHGKNGATELFYIKKNYNDSGILFVNYYNYIENITVPFDILVAKKELHELSKNYMVDPNTVLCIAKTNINTRQKMLGVIITKNNCCKFYFAETVVNNSVSSRMDDVAITTRNYMIDFYNNTINLNEMLQAAGATITNDKDICDIDMSYETIEKDSIINLFKK